VEKWMRIKSRAAENLCQSRGFRRGNRRQESASRPREQTLAWAEVGPRPLVGGR